MTQRDTDRWLCGGKTRSRSTSLRSGQSLTEFIAIVVLVGFVVIGMISRYDSSQWWRILLDHFYQDSLMMPVEMIRFDDIEEPKSLTKSEETVTRYHLSVSADPPIGGNVTGTGFYNQGTLPAAVIGQSPSSGYQFVKWEGNIHSPLKDDVWVTAKYKKQSSGGGSGGDSGSDHPYNPGAIYRFSTHSDGTIMIRGYIAYNIEVDKKVTDKDGKTHTKKTTKKVTRESMRYEYNQSFQLTNTTANPQDYAQLPPRVPPPNIKFSKTSTSEQNVMIQTGKNSWSKLGTIHFDSNGNPTHIDFESPYNQSGP